MKKVPIEKTTRVGKSKINLTGNSKPLNPKLSELTTLGSPTLIHFPVEISHDMT
jgi:hypothetical protein